MQLKEDVKGVEVAFGDLEKNVGPGSRTAVAANVANRPTIAAAPATDSVAVDPDDPNKRQFGSLSERNGRKLSAAIELIAGPKSSQCRVNIRVVSTDPARPLIGKLKLYLHPTFGQRSSYAVEAKGGMAEDTIVSYGAFTIAA